MTPTANRDDDPWVLVRRHGAIRVYRRRDDHERLKTFRGVMRMQLADEYALVALANDYEALPEWVHFIRHVEEIKRDGPLRRWLRFTTNLPWPLHDREAVLRMNVEQRRDAHEDAIWMDIENAPDLIEPDPDYLRFPQLHGYSGMRRLPGDEVEVVYQMVVNPGGQIPVWLVNRVLRDAPFFTLAQLRRMVRRPEYQGHYFDYVDLKGPGRPDRDRTGDGGGNNG